MRPSSMVGACLVLLAPTLAYAGMKGELMRFGEDAETGAQFYIVKSEYHPELEPCRLLNAGKSIAALVPENMNLLNDERAKDIARRAALSYWNRCPIMKQEILDFQKSYGAHRRGSINSTAITALELWGQPRGYLAQFEVTPDGEMILTNSVNYERQRAEREASAAQKRQEAARRAEFAEVARKAREELAQRHAARRGDEQRARWQEFVQRTKVKAFVKPAALFANPFVHQGKRVAVLLRFERMIAAEAGLFEGEENALFVVSGLPNGTFTARTGGRELLAVEFSQMTNVSGIPIVGSMDVPELRFVDRATCTDWQCSNMIR